MKRRRSAPEAPMPSVVVLIPAADADVVNTRPALATSSKASPSPSRSHRASTSAATSAPKISSSSSPSRPSSAIYPARASSSKPRRPLLAASSSSSSLSASSDASRHDSSSSTSSSLASSSSRGFSNRSRTAHHAVPVDPTNPFGPDDAYMSAKRSPADGQSLYVCQWRLRDKKDLLDTNGHTYCHCRLMTADLLARHVLSEHLTTDMQYGKTSAQHKTACKWGNCFNRHYDPQGLAAHVVHDHFTHQMGLKYSCIVKNCTTKTILTSLNALDSHHARYHANSIGTQPLRPIWQLVSVSSGQKPSSQLLTALRKLDSAPPPSLPHISVSARANPKLSPLSEHVRTTRELNWKRRYLDPIEVRPGEGQDGQPWIRLHKRLQQSKDYWDGVQAADDAILHAVDYTLADLGRLQAEAISSIELDGDPTLRAIERGLRQAQIYTSGKRGLRVPATLALPSPDSCYILAPEPSAEQSAEVIGPVSLTSIEREMNFDASLSKQRRWIDQLLKRGAGSTNNPATAGKDTAADLDSDIEDVTDDWAPPLRLEPYHPASRYLNVLADDDDQPAPREKPKAPRRHMEVMPEAAFSDGGSSPLSSSPSTRDGSPEVLDNRTTSSLQLQPALESTFAALAGVKREREDDIQPLSEGHLANSWPATSKVKKENDIVEPPHRHTQHGAHRPVDELRSFTQAPFFIEVAPNNLVETSPTLYRSSEFEQEPGRLGKARQCSLRG